MENQMQKKMENELETGGYTGLRNLGIVNLPLGCHPLLPGYWSTKNSMTHLMEGRRKYGPFLGPDSLKNWAIV